MKALFERFPTLLGLAGTHEILGLAGITDTDKKNYVTTNYPTAKVAGAKFGLNPIVILAQGALESGWGTSYMARNIFNFFGITAAGKPNEFWKGENYVSKSSGLKFRKYANSLACFSDFARLISTKYLAATKASSSIADYAREISNSPYAEQDPVSRENYRKGVISNAAYILKTIGSPEAAAKLTADAKSSPVVSPPAKAEPTQATPTNTNTAKTTDEGHASFAAPALIGLAAALLLFSATSKKSKT